MATKPKLVQPETPNEIQNRDLFQTPFYATDLLIPYLKNLSIYNVWEPACGKGKIVDRLNYHNVSCVGTDLSTNPSVNFLTELPYFNFDCIITNPPFSLKKKFYERCKSLCDKWAILIPADYSSWIIDSIRYDKCSKIIPTRRVDYITPTKKQGKESTSQFHSMWLTHGFNLNETEVFVELTKEMKLNI